MKDYPVITRKQFRDLKSGDLVVTESLKFLIIDCELDEEDKKNPELWTNCQYFVICITAYPHSSYIPHQGYFFTLHDMQALCLRLIA